MPSSEVVLVSVVDEDGDVSVKHLAKQVSIVVLSEEQCHKTVEVVALLPFSEACQH